MSKSRILPVIIFAIFNLFEGHEAFAQGNLRVGSARVDIRTPIDPANPPSGKYAHEKLYVLAIVLDNGSVRAALNGAPLTPRVLDVAKKGGRLGLQQQGQDQKPVGGRECLLKFGQRRILDRRCDLHNSPAGLGDGGALGAFFRSAEARDAGSGKFAFRFLLFVLMASSYPTIADPLASVTPSANSTKGSFNCGVLGRAFSSEKDLAACAGIPLSPCLMFIFDPHEIDA